jgi:hypothetical protein
MSSDPRADAILAKFPGPVTLSVSRRKWFLMLVGSGAFTAAGIAMASSNASTGWPGAIFFGLCTVVATVMLLPGAGMLRLDRDGFEVTSLFRRHRSRWPDTRGFESAAIPPSMIHRVVYDDANLSGKSIAWLNAMIAGHNAGLPDTFGLSSARDLADLMTRWRERALTRQ